MAETERTMSVEPQSDPRPSCQPDPHPGVQTLTPFRQGKSTLDDHVNPIKLSANESHHGPSPFAIEAYRNHSGQLFRYPDGAQHELRTAIAETFGLRAQGIVCGNGSDELLQLLIRAYVRPGDEVVFSRHSFAMAIVHATAQGAKIVIAEEPRLRPDTDRLLAAVTPRTRAVVIASPNNPVGRYLPRAELERLRRELPAEIVLIVDAAYADYVVADDFEPGQALVDAGSNTVMTRTFSKLYGLAGLRIGWMYAPSHVVDAIERIRTPFSASADAMAAATAAVRDVRYAEFVRDYNLAQLRRIEESVRALGSGIEFLSSHANFYLLRFDDGRHTPEGAAAALESSGIIPRPVAAGGPPQCLRITVGLQHENDAVIGVLADYMAA
jgi:histidinol-phosphate aminotransferase